MFTGKCCKNEIQIAIARFINRNFKLFWSFVQNQGTCQVLASITKNLKSKNVCFNEKDLFYYRTRTQQTIY